MKHLIIYMLCAFCLPLSAQRITRQYNNVSMADALKELNTLQNKYAVNFIYDDLEDFRVSTTVRSLSVPDAVSRIVGFYPIAVTQKGNVIMVECVNKAQQKYTGRIVDKSGSPVEFANVALFTPDTHTLIAGGVSNADGLFVIPSDAPSVVLEVSFVGYKTVTKHLDSHNVGTIRIYEDQYTLKGVSVTEIRPTITYKADRYVVNIRNSILGTGNTAHSLLTQLPGVWTNGSSISINGIAGTRVMVNDRLVNLSGDQLMNYLKTIRSEEIEHIEIIANPPAEFAAEGTGGFLRIITRQRQSGSELTVGNQIDFLNYKATEPEVYYSHSRGSFGFDVSANGTFGKGYLRSDELTKNRSSLTDYDNHIIDRMDDAIYSLNTNLYYDVNDRNKLALNLNYYHWYKDEHIDGQTTITGNPMPDITKTLTRHETIQRDDEWNASLNYTRMFGEEARHKLLVMADLSASRYPVKDYLSYDNYDTADQLLSQEDYYYLNKNPYTIASTEIRSQWNWQKGGSLMAGVKFSHSEKKNDFTAQTLLQDVWQDMTERNYKLNYKEDLQATYLKYERSQKTWDLTAGIRAEYNKASAEGYDFSYHHFDLFPSVYFSYHPVDRHQINLSASRRTQRVRFNQLLPYRYYFSRYTIQEGNPLLRPNYSNHLNLTYLLMKKYSLSLNYVWSNNGIESYNRTTTIGDQQLTSSTYIDGVKARYFNLNAYVPVKISSKWSMTNQFRLSNNRFHTSETHVRTFSWSMYTQQTIILPWDIRFQLLYRYNSKSRSAYGKSDDYHVLNTSWLKTFMGDRLTCKLSIDDWFWAQKPKDIVNNSSIYQESRMYGRQMPSFSLSVTYTISKGKQTKHADIEKSNSTEKERAM